MHSVLCEIIDRFNPSLLVQLEEALKLHVTNFKRDLFPSLLLIDKAIPGVGFQYVIWREDGYDPKFPFPGDDFDAVARSMKYIPSTLASGMKFANMARSITQCSGAHVEACIKATCHSMASSRFRYDRMPIGTLAKNREIIRFLGITLTQPISEYADLLVNKSKHDYAGGSGYPVISFTDAIGSYFASRILGFQVLEKGGILEAYIADIQQAFVKGIVYSFPDNSDPGDDPKEWPLQTNLSDLAENTEDE